MSTEADYEAAVYYPPPVAIIVGSILRAPRWIRYNGNFTLLFSPVREQQLDYVDGLMVTSSIFLIFVVMWATLLIVLKFKGKEVGCASGRAFVTLIPEDPFDGRSDGDYDCDDNNSTTSSSSGTNSSKPLFPEHGDHRVSKKSRAIDMTMGLPEISTDWIEPDGSIGRSASDDGLSGTAEVTRHSDEGVNSGEGKNRNSLQDIINRRERRTRICFLLFASMALTCVPLIFVFSLGPIKEATQSAEAFLLSITDTMDEVAASLLTIESSSISALEILNKTPTELEVICPLVPEKQLEAEIGIDLSDVVRSVADNYDRLRMEVKVQLDLGHAVVERVQSGIANFQSSVATTEDHLWVIPTLLFVLSVLASTSVIGVVLAWKEKSSLRFQRFMSWVVLPSLIVVATSCWVTVLMASLGSMVGTDMCTSSSATGSPDQTIQEILSLHRLGINDTVYQLTSAYTNQCKGPDPTEALQNLEAAVQDHLDTIWRQMSEIDSLGRAQVIEKCGNAEAFTAMLTGARNLAKLLTAIRRALSSISTSLQCSAINPIYAVASHETLCTETVTAVVCGFIMFLIVAICTMVMITLRASWLRHIQEEKVYHDEDDVADNMILDEHEEYLAYISRYKHEWQEYGGFENDATINSAENYDDEGTNDESVYTDDEPPRNNCSLDVSEGRSEASKVYLKNMGTGNNPTAHRKNSINERTSPPSDDVSFPSLSSHRTGDDQGDQVSRGENASSSIALLPLPKKTESQYGNDFEFANFPAISSSNTSSSEKSNDKVSSATMTNAVRSLAHFATEPCRTPNSATASNGTNQESIGSVNIGSYTSLSAMLEHDRAARSESSDFDDNFDIFSHDQQSTGEVEVRLSERIRYDPPSI